MTAKKIMASVLVILCLSLIFNVVGGRNAYATEGDDVANTWIQDEEGNWYYLNEYEIFVTGWEKIDGDWYYFYEDDDRYGVMADSTFEEIDAKIYYFESSGKMAIGWRQLYGDWYYFYQSGSMATGWEKIDGDWYYLYSDGRMASDDLVYTNHNYYYVDASGKMIPNKWKKNSTGWWYEHGDGSYQSDAALKIDGDWYYFDDDGYMIIGWFKKFDSWYYSNSSGRIVSGWEYIDGDWYYFSHTYYDMFSDRFAEIDGEIYYFNPSGSMATGWEKINEKWFYFNTSGHMLTGWQEIGDDWYYFYEYEDEENLGVMVSDDIVRYIDENNNIPYYLDHSGKRLPSELKTGKHTLFFLGNGEILTFASVKIDGIVYCFDSAGYLTVPCPWEEE